MRNYGAVCIAVPAVIAHVRQLHGQGATLYCWSFGGAEYARECALEAGIEGCFSGFLPKPQVMSDDQLVSAWKRLLQVHPNSCVGMSADEYRERMKPAR